MEIDEVAHGEGEVVGGPALGELDVPPRPMRIDRDEEIGGAVAAILVVDTLRLSRRRGDGLADLADELDRAFVEADHRPHRVGGFGVEVEDILHAGDIVSVELGNAPHILLPGLEVILA